MGVEYIILMLLLLLLYNNNNNSNNKYLYSALSCVTQSAVTQNECNII